MERIKTLYENSFKLQTIYEFINIKKLLVSTNDLVGDVVEVGICQGDSALLIKNFMNNNKRLYLFDTFEGIQDVCEFDGKSLTNNSFISSYETVRMKFKYRNVRIYKGYFPDSIHKKFEEKWFSFVHLDVDTYQSTKNCLEFFYDRMVTGGIILTHDYVNLSAIGVKKAFDEFFKDKEEKIQKLVDSQAMIIKK